LKIEPSGPLCDGLLAYLGELLAWNRAYNLTAVRSADDAVTRHLLDSLAILPWVQGERLLDVGTGPGLPGIPLALARPDRQHVLLDSNGKKVRFLRHVIRTLGLNNVEAVQARVENLEDGDGFDCITARAFAPMPRLLRWVGPLLAPGGRLLAMCGRDDRSQEIEAGFRLLDNIELRVPYLDAERRLLIVEIES
jgi:16S rRNA (guanine527-N7)-methyltransferase